VIELTEQVVAALLVTARQGLALRRQLDGGVPMSAAPEAMLADLESRLPLIVEDRALDIELRQLLAAIRGEAWSLYAD
jgi:histidine ammonia-lyase